MKWLFLSKTFYKKNKQWFKKKVKKGTKIDIESQVDEKGAENYDEIIGRMAAFFAHEIRNPLTSIIGFTQFLEQDKIVQSNPNLAQYLSIIKEEAVRMETLIKELLSLSTADFQRDNLSIIDVKYTVEKMVVIFNMRPHNKDVQFTTELADETYINGNTARFEQLLINLINNSIEASGDDCTIVIRIEKDDEYVSIFIIDNGAGIEPEQLEQVFYPLYTTKDDGTGIGLPICKAIVETLGGTISIQNHLPKGTQVRLKVPLIKHTL